MFMNDILYYMLFYSLDFIFMNKQNAVQILFHSLIVVKWPAEDQL